MWRLLVEHEVDHHIGLAVDDSITQCASFARHITLRLYTYRPCVLVGRFQHVADHVHISRCRELNIPINRRPTGGGTIMMGPDQLGIALTVPPNCSRFTNRSSELINQCASGLSTALHRLGIESYCRGKNDLEVNSRKIAGLGLYQSKNGGKLFHASLLLDLDVELMLELLRTPFEKYQDRGFSSIADRITTISMLSDETIGMSQLIEIVKSGYEEEFSVQLDLKGMSQSESTLATQLDETQYSTEQWISLNPSRIRDRRW